MKNIPTLSCTLVAGRYHGTGYEYAPFVCIHPEGHGPDLSKTEWGAPDSNAKAIAIANVRSVRYGNAEEAAKAQAEDVAVIAEIVKRMNAYTKLVDLAREAKRCAGHLTEHDEWPADSSPADLYTVAMQLLRELGEAS